MADNFAARQCKRYTVVCLAPDVCMTPSKSGYPVPYIVSITLDNAQDTTVAKKTNFNSNKAFMYSQSETPNTKGDTAGKGKGVVSKTHYKKGRCIPTQHSPSVRVEGKYMVRENDYFDMNVGKVMGVDKANTIGKLTTLDEGAWYDKAINAYKWAEKQKSDYEKAKRDTLLEAVEAPMNEVKKQVEKALEDPLGYAQDLVNSGVEAAQAEAQEWIEVREINQQRANQLWEQFQTNPSGAAGEFYGDIKDEAVIFKDELGNTLSETWSDVKDWGSDLRDKVSDIQNIAEKGDIGKAAGTLSATATLAAKDIINPAKKAKVAGKVAGTVGTTAKKSAALKKKKMKDKEDKKNGVKALTKKQTEMCGEITTFGESKKNAINTPGKVQFDRDHIPASSYMIEKAQQMIESDPTLQQYKMNECVEKAIVNNAKVILIPKPIHTLGWTYGVDKATMVDNGDLALTPKQAADRDIATYRNMLKSKGPTNKKDAKLTKEDRAKRRVANKKCKEGIEEGLKEMEKVGHKQFLIDQIENNQNC